MHAARLWASLLPLRLVMRPDVVEGRLDFLQVKAVGKLNKWYEEKGVLGQVRSSCAGLASAMWLCMFLPIGAGAWADAQCLLLSRCTSALLPRQPGILPAPPVHPPPLHTHTLLLHPPPHH